MKIQIKKENIQQNVRNSFLNKTGMYTVKIKKVLLRKYSSNSEQLVYIIDYNNNESIIFGPFLKDKEGNSVEFALKHITQLAVVSKIDSDELDFEQQKLTLFNNKSETVKVCTDLSNIDVIIRLQMEYSKYNDEIRESRVIRSFYTLEGISAYEIIHDKDHGKEFEMESSYNNVNTYKDGLTEEEVDNWLKERKTKNKKNQENSESKEKVTQKRLNVFD